MKRLESYKDYSLKYLKTIKIGDIIYFASDSDKPHFKNYPDEIVVSIDKTHKINHTVFKIFTDNKTVYYKIYVCNNKTGFIVGYDNN